MQHKRFSQILGTSVAMSLVVAMVIVGHSLIKAAIAVRGRPPVCLPASSSEARCFSAETTLVNEAITAIATSHHGTLLATASGPTIRLWDLSSGRPARVLQGHHNWITALVISPDGQTLASSSLDQTIQLWDLKRNAPPATLKSGRVTHLAFSPDGRILASGSRLLRWPDGAVSSPTIQLWDVTTRQLTNTLASEPVTALAFSPDGQYLAGGSQRAHLWHLASGQLVQTLASGELNSLIFSGDGKQLITGSDGVRGEDGIKFWQVPSGKRLRVLDSVATDMALNPAGTILATTYGGNVNLWKMEPFGFLGSLRGSFYSGLFTEFGWDGQAVVTGGSDGVKVWRLSQAGNLSR